ncbi:MAG TPA: hypothetical protein VLH39_03140, partial [Magnetospirillaceae bacterium]|nr:hypothetical protein [Magnetospirillaceae bacterium]
FSSRLSRLDVSWDRASFLDRIQLDIRISAEGDPDRVYLRIPVIESGSVFDSNYPIRPMDGGKGLSVSVGARPPEPLVISLTVSLDFSAPAEVIAVYRSPFLPFRAEGLVEVIEHVTETRSEVLLRGSTELGS